MTLPKSNKLNLAIYLRKYFNLTSCTIWDNRSHGRVRSRVTLLEIRRSAAAAAKEVLPMDLFSLDTVLEIL